MTSNKDLFIQMCEAGYSVFDRISFDAEMAAAEDLEMAEQDLALGIMDAPMEFWTPDDIGNNLNFYNDKNI